MSRMREFIIGQLEEILTLSGEYMIGNIHQPSTAENVLMRDAFAISLQFIRDDGLTVTYSPDKEGKHAWRVHAAASPGEGHRPDAASDQSASG